MSGWLSSVFTFKSQKWKFISYSDTTSPRHAVFRYVYIYRESASRLSRGTVLNTLKRSGINILGGKKDTTTFSWQAWFVKRFTKQACLENVVASFFPPKKKKYIYIYIYIYILTVIVGIALLERFHRLFFAGCNQPWNYKSCMKKSML